jgi:hypothetical protein
LNVTVIEPRSQSWEMISNWSPAPVFESGKTQFVDHQQVLAGQGRLDALQAVLFYGLHE